MNELHDLPDYELMRHARAKQLRLSVNSLGKIKVTAPKHVSKSIVVEFVKENLDWIQNAISSQRDSRLGHPNLGLQVPMLVSLKAIGAAYRVSEVYAKKAHYVEEKDYLYLYGENSDVRLEGLKSWVKNKATQVLPQRLDWHAQKMDLSYNNVIVKNQKTRWGSCSTKKNINLNQNLLFVDIELLNYLLIHELSHLKHLNHSARFWRVVAKYDAEFKLHDKQLNAAVKTLPLWALPSH